MIKIDIEFICDECGKSKKERTIVIKGYEDVGDELANVNRAYMPTNWSVMVSKNKIRLYCTKCTKKRTPKNAIWVA